MLRKVCRGHGQEAERHSGRWLPGDAAASAPPPGDPHVCIMAVRSSPVNRTPRAAPPPAPVLGKPRTRLSPPRRPPKRRPDESLRAESGFDAQAFPRRSRPPAAFHGEPRWVSSMYTDAARTGSAEAAPPPPHLRHPGTASKRSAGRRIRDPCLAAHARDPVHDEARAARLPPRAPHPSASRPPSVVASRRHLRPHCVGWRIANRQHRRPSSNPTKWGGGAERSEAEGGPRCPEPGR